MKSKRLMNSWCGGPGNNKIIFCACSLNFYFIYRQIFPAYSTAQRRPMRNSALARIRERRCRGGLGVAAASGEAHSTQGLLEVWQSSQGLGRLEELGRVVVVQSLQD